MTVKWTQEDAERIAAEIRQEIAIRRKKHADKIKVLSNRLRRLSSPMTKEERKRDSRRKIQLGVILTKLMAQDQTLKELVDMEIQSLTRKHDRALFGLPPLEAEKAENAQEEANPEMGSTTSGKRINAAPKGNSV